MPPTDAATHPAQPGDTDAPLDLLIVGAGVSGIGLAVPLLQAHADLRVLVLDARDEPGGTWSLFRYPGIRSDSDLHTFGFDFKPWVGEKAIADGPSILAYLHETVREFGLAPRLRLRHRVLRADWRSDERQWHVQVERPGAAGTPERVTLRTRWLVGAAGYYRHEAGHQPPLPGLDTFAGPVVHPQQWPQGLDHAGRRVLIVGSGATAVTLAPAMAATAARVTVLQRTPTYVLPVPSVDPLANGLRRLLGALGRERWAHALVRRKNIALQAGLWAFCRRRPALARRLIRWVVRRSLPPGYPVDTHFNPPYAPWDQRLCVAPDGDFFKAIRAGRVEMVTDRIERFTAGGVRLASGRVLEADIVVTATGLQLLPMGGIPLAVDGRPVHLPDTVAYKGMMLSGVPNFAFAVGYTNASWTLKVGLVATHLVRLVAHMRRQRLAVCTPEAPPPGTPTTALLDFGAGYIQRALHTLPRQGPAAPWVLPMRHAQNVALLRDGPVDGPHLRFEPEAPG